MGGSDDVLLANLERGVRAAERACAANDYANALKIYRAILTERLDACRGDVGQLLAADLVVVDRLADLSALFGLFNAADDLLNGMAALTRSKGNDLAADYAQLKRAELSLSRGAVGEAFDRLRELEERIGDITAFDMSAAGFQRWERQTAWRNLPAVDRQVLFSRVYYLFTRLLSASGEYVHAIRAAECSELHTGRDAADLAQQARLPIALARASALFGNGDIDDAADALRNLQSAAEHQSAQPGWRVLWLELRARLALARGEFGSAAARLEDVLNICRLGKFRQAAAAAHLNFAHLLILLNRIRDALWHIEKAEGTAADLKDGGALARARFLRSIAEARRHSLAQGVSLELSVTEMLRRGHQVAGPIDDGGDLTEVPQSPDFLTFFEDRALRLQWLVAKGNLAGARAFFADISSEQMFGRTPSRLIRTRLVVLQGLLAYYCSEPRIAMDLLTSSATKLEILGLRPELWQVMRLQGWCASQLGEKAQEQVLVDRAERVLQEIANSLEGAERAIFLLNKWTAQEEYLAGEINRLVVEKADLARSRFFARPFIWLKMARHLNRLISQIDQHKALIANSTVGSVVHVRGGGPSLWRRMLSGSRRRIVISFLVLPDRILVVQTGFGHLNFHVGAITRIELREQVRRWHECMQSSMTTRDIAALPRPRSDAGGPTELAEVLADALQLKPLLLSLPARATELIVVPDDTLHGFPFAALNVGHRQLIDRFAVSTRFDAGPVSRPKRIRHKGALLVAVSRGSGKIPPLPQTVKEIQRVRHWLTQHGIASDVLVDDRATRFAVVDALRQATIVHIACHGMFVPDRPEASGMLLIPDPQRTEILSLRDMSQLQLSECAHITLSSCWSADNFILPGRWVVSLPETLYRAGARSILGCTWAVDDRVAELFLTRFYAHAGALTRAEALRQTQLECRARKLAGCEDIDTSDPFYWAGFTLFGDPDRLELRAGTG